MMKELVINFILGLVGIPLICVSWFLYNSIFSQGELNRKVNNVIAVVIIGVYLLSALLANCFLYRRKVSCGEEFSIKRFVVTNFISFIFPYVIIIVGSLIVKLFNGGPHSAIRK